MILLPLPSRSLLRAIQLVGCQKGSNRLDRKGILANEMIDKNDLIVLNPGPGSSATAEFFSALSISRKPNLLMGLVK